MTILEIIEILICMVLWFLLMAKFFDILFDAARKLDCYIMCSIQSISVFVFIAVHYENPILHKLVANGRTH